jgi:hypothetical protein
MGIHQFGEVWLPFFIGICKRAFGQYFEDMNPLERCNNLMVMIDLTQVAVSVYRIKKETNKYQIFEKAIAARICRYLATFDKTTCVLCKKRLTEGGSWKTTSQNGDYCSCKKLPIYQLMHRIETYLKANNKRLHVVLLYDSRTLNPLARFITSSTRRDQRGFMTKEEFLQACRQNAPLLKSLYDLSYGENVLESTTGTPPPKSSSLKKKHATSATLSNPGSKTVESIESYISQKFVHAVTDQWLVALSNSILKTNPEHCGLVSCSPEDTINLLTQLQPDNNDHLRVIIDAIPRRAFLFQTCLTEKLPHKQLWNFSNPTFAELFYDYYIDTAGYTTCLKFMKQLHINNMTLRTLHQGPVSEPHITENEYKEQNVCILYISGQPSVYYYDQMLGISCGVGESDIKTLPYLSNFMLNLTTIQDTKTIWINSIDADIFVVLMLFVHDTFQNVHVSPYSFNASQRYEYTPHAYGKVKRTTWILLDRGFKDIDEETREAGRNSTYVGPKDFINTHSEISDTSLLLNPMSNLKDEDKLFEYEPEDAECNDEQANGTNKKRSSPSPAKKKRAINPQQQEKKSNELYAKGVQFVDILELYKIFVNWIGQHNFTSFFLYMFLSGSDYTQNIPDIRATKLLNTFEQYKHTEPYFFAPDKNSSLLSLGNIPDVPKSDDFTDGDDEHGENKEHMGPLWILHMDNIKRLCILIYIKNLKKAHKVAVQKALVSLKSIHICDKTYDQIYFDLSNSVEDVLKAEAKAAEKKRVKDGKMMPLSEILGEFTRACYEINYYLGCEGINSKIRSCDQSVKTNASIWGWRQMPECSTYFLDDKLTDDELTAWMAEKIDYIRSCQKSFLETHPKDDSDTSMERPKHLFHDITINEEIRNLQATKHVIPGKRAKDLRNIIRLLVYIHTTLNQTKKLKWRIVKDNLFLAH